MNIQMLVKHKEIKGIENSAQNYKVNKVHSLILKVSIIIYTENNTVYYV